MTRKTRLLVVGTIIVIVVLVFIWILILLFPRKAVTPEVTETKTAVTQQDKTATPEQKKLDQKQEGRTQASGVTTVSRTFVERYGSYSNEANFQNLKDVLPLMTDAFAKITQNAIDTSKLPATYYGVTTNVLVMTVEKNDDAAGVATVLLNTQRITAQGSTQNISTTYQKIRLQLLKQSGTWKVDSATWL